MERGAARRAGKWVVLLATLLLYVVASATLTEARAHGAAHEAPQTQAKVAVHPSGAAANCLPQSLDCRAAAHATCCSMAGCSAPLASLPSSHLLPDDARREAAFPIAAASVPVGIGASPLTPPPRRAA
jgi:hypothetical protein